MRVPVAFMRVSDVVSGVGSKSGKPYSRFEVWVTMKDGIPLKFDFWNASSHDRFANMGVGEVLDMEILPGDGCRPSVTLI